MLKFFSNARTFTYREGQVKFRTWFARIIRSSIVDQIRDASRQKNLDAEIPEQPAIPSIKFSSKNGAKPPSKRRKTNSAAVSMKRPGRRSKCTDSRTATPNRSRSFSV